MFISNRALDSVSCKFCRPCSRIEPRNRGNRDPPAATTDGHFTREKRRVLRPRVFSAVNSHVPDRSLRWWCGCHHGETACHWQPFVTRKFPNQTPPDDNWCYHVVSLFFWGWFGDWNSEEMKAFQSTNIWRFPKSWGYPQFLQVMDDHVRSFLYWNPVVTWGSPSA